MDFNYESLLSGIPDNGYTSYLREQLKASSANIDGLTAQRDKLRDERNNLDYTTGSSATAGTLGAMVLPLIAGMFAPGGSDARFGTALLGAGKGAELYYNNLEADEKERKLFLDRDIDRADKDIARKEVMQDRAVQGALGMQEKLITGAIPGTAPWNALQAADQTKWENRQGFLEKQRQTQEEDRRNYEIEKGMASGTLKYDPRVEPIVPEQIGTTLEGKPIMSEVPPDDALIAGRPINPVWDLVRKEKEGRPMDPELGAFIQAKIKSPVAPKTASEARQAIDAATFERMEAGEARRLKVAMGEFPKDLPAAAKTAYGDALAARENLGKLKSVIDKARRELPESELATFTVQKLMKMVPTSDQQLLQDWLDFGGTLTAIAMSGKQMSYREAEAYMNFAGGTGAFAADQLSSRLDFLINMAENKAIGELKANTSFPGTKISADNAMQSLTSYVAESDPRRAMQMMNIYSGGGAGSLSPEDSELAALNELLKGR